MHDNKDIIIKRSTYLNHMKNSSLFIFHKDGFIRRKVLKLVIAPAERPQFTQK